MNNLNHIIQLVFGNTDEVGGVWVNKIYRSNYTMTDIEIAYTKSTEQSGVDFKDICFDSEYLNPEETEKLIDLGIDVDGICESFGLDKEDSLDYDEDYGWCIFDSILEKIFIDFITKSIPDLELEKFELPTFGINIGQSIYGEPEIF